MNSQILLLTSTDNSEAEVETVERNNWLCGLLEQAGEVMLVNDFALLIPISQSIPVRAVVIAINHESEGRFADFARTLAPEQSRFSVGKYTPSGFSAVMDAGDLPRLLAA